MKSTGGFIRPAVVGHVILNLEPVVVSNDSESSRFDMEEWSRLGCRTFRIL